MASDSDAVHSYASEGLRLWAAGTRPHGLVCPCLICADTRAYTGWPVLIPNIHRVMVVPDEEWGPDSLTELLERGPR